MKESNRISNSELEIMKILWKEAPLNSTEIINRLKCQSDWSRKTIHTFISRLVKKNVLRVLNGYKQKEYYPTITKNEYKKSETELFVKKIYNGSFILLVSDFIKNESLTENEINELKKMLLNK
ncbi:BlaI/MecI/CopY family transcriptional regulator [Abyssisolibacter fermentans]|uniref:BlaI/MecI/CopY family transcriptional regulator n=1 Tax=Abyssisolibacter fermentans TaxID=1766203 RepID=UPI00082D15C9|nr:BlaI/MecI/CopY family transcriptional regulator [Abyssisolibacter fermentans]